MTFEQWLQEKGFDAGSIDLDRIPIDDGFEHVDPDKESKAQDRDLANGTTNYSNIYARKGKDWEEELEQSIREELMKKKIRQRLEKELGVKSDVTEEIEKKKKETENAKVAVAA